MAVSDVRRVALQVASDGRVTQPEVGELMSSTGGSIGNGEEAAVGEYVQKWAQDGLFEPDARVSAEGFVRSMARMRASAARHNEEVAAQAPALRADVESRLTVGASTHTFGGSALPDAVKTVVNEALAEGAIAYDVRELKPDPVYDTTHGEPEVIVDGRFNPYSQESEATDTLAFDYTELTPERIAADMAAEAVYDIAQPPLGGTQTVRTRPVRLQPNGSIRNNYDEADWPVTTARGPGGEKHASNFAILADGSVHAVPWSRRSRGNPGLILTTASLARGKQMLFNGHIGMERGVVTYVGRSGRLGNLAEDGTTFIDPLAVMRAWGFQLRPGLTVTQE